ncbi:MAG TPA: FUSC family protein [Candidatus Sulfotelmatobacter sp.]|nr:FUSC family protein [Candidatus Sulfotelmatobacter sp.]
MSKWSTRLGLTREAFLKSGRVTVATVISLLLARMLKLPEFYWAPISTIVILLSTINPLTLAWQRFAGTAIGAFLGALIASYPHQNWAVYGGGIFVCGIVSFILRVGAAYRFAAIALSIVVLIAHNNSPWTVALHRFIEVSLGIAVALLVSRFWRMPATGARGNL